MLSEKMGMWPFVNFPGNQSSNLKKGTDYFAEKDTAEQVVCLMNILLMMGPGSTGVDLTACGGTKKAGKKSVSTKLTNWKKRYTDVRIIDESASGLFSRSSENLLDLL